MSRFALSIAIAAMVLLTFASLSPAVTIYNEPFNQSNGTDVTTLTNWSGTAGVGLINSGELTVQSGGPQVTYNLTTGTTPALPTFPGVFRTKVDFPNTMAGAANSWFGMTGSGLGDSRFAVVEVNGANPNAFFRIWTTSSTTTGGDTGIALSALTTAEIQAVSDGTNFTSARVILNNGAYDSGFVSVISSNAIANLDGILFSGSPGPMTVGNLLIQHNLPEPSSLLLCGGLALLGLVRRRRQR